MIVNVHKCRPIYHPIPVLAWLIMIFQKMLPWKKNSWSHMCLSYHSQFHNEIYMDATSKSVRLAPEFIYKKRYEIVETVKIDIKDSHGFYKWVESQLGKEYDNLQLIGIAAKVLNFISFNKLGRDYEKLICSELILNMIQRFKGANVIDSDNWDLLMTWALVKKHEA